jgi:ParB-like chromosome segregation protein Spo0J
MGRWRRARFEAKVSQRAHALKKQLRQIGDSIKAFGWTNPILIDGDRVVIAGHGRLEAAISLGIVQVPPFASTI